MPRDRFVMPGMAPLQHGDNPRSRIIAPPMAPMAGRGNDANALFTDKITLSDGQPQRIVNLSYDSERKIHANIACPYALNIVPTFNVPLNHFHGNANADVLFVLGTAIIGTHRTQLQVDFDIPVGQLARLSCIAQTLTVSCRLYKCPPANGGGQVFMWSTPVYTLPVDTPASLVATAGEGYPGPSHLVRQWIGQVGGAGTIDFQPPPDLATSVIVLGSTADLTVTDLGFGTNAAAASSAGPMSIGPGNEYPLIQCATLRVSNSNAAARDAAVQFRLGLGDMF
jgi:hypothetical protein